MYLNPLPTALLEELRSKELVLVPELNYQGQWASVLQVPGSEGGSHHAVHRPALQGERPGEAGGRQGEIHAKGNGNSMSAKNPEYDFKWCPGCGDFAVRRALESAMSDRMTNYEIPIENNVVVAGIGCSGNLVHLLEGDQPYGFHGIHGRSLPIAMGVKMGRPDLNVVVVAGDGDFLSIGMEHIAPQAARNLDICAVIMDNAVYGLTKGQSSPTTELGETTSSTPYGKMEASVNPLALYLTLGVSFIASGFSGKPRELADLITQGMEHPGFAVVHVQSPCTTYNNTYQILKGNPRKGIAPVLWDLPEDHDAADYDDAHSAIRSGGIPVGVIYRDTDRPTLTKTVEDTLAKVKPMTMQQMIDFYEIK